MKIASPITRESSLWRTSLCSLPMLLGIPLAAQVVTRTPAPGSETVKLENFVVTGSHLQRLEVEKTLPLTVVDQEMMNLREAQTPIDLLTALPQIMSVPLNEVATLGATARGDNAAVGLRGLSSGSTLMLLNGRRLAPHPISPAEGGVPALSPNANQLPVRGVERIEVLRDGASSIYGSDAVAGVVNYVMDMRYRGSELVLRYADTEEGGGREFRATARYGTTFAKNKGRFVATADVFDREIIFASQRSFSADADHTNFAPPPWDNYATGTSFFARSTGSAYGNFTIGTLSSTGAFTGTRPMGVPAALASTAGSFFLVPTTTGVGFKNSTPARVGIERDYYYNLSAARVAQPGSRRYNVFTGAEYDLGKKLTAFADLSYYRADSTTSREPDQYASSTDAPIVVAADNPWNPFGTRFWHLTGASNPDGTARLTGRPSPVRLVNKRFVDLPSRVADIKSELYRVVAGVRGDIFDNWKWEAAALHTVATTRDIEHNSTRESRLISAISGTNPAQTFNPFGYNFAVQNGALAVTTPYQNPTSLIQTIQEDYIRDGETSVSSFDVRGGGRLLEIWGGNHISIAGGGEYRRETYSDKRPPYAGLNPPGSGLDPTDNDFIALSPNSDTDASRDLIAGYLELAVPLVGNRFRLPLVNAFEVSASARYERYSDFGSSRKPKIGATWRPTTWLMARASYNEGFRAPNLAQLFTGELTRSNTSADTYRSIVTQLPADGSANRLERRSGNERLHPEQSRGKGAGVVIDVPRIKGLSVSADYWEINQTGVIDNTTALADDFDALIAATKAGLAAGQNINAIDLGSGTADYKGSPNMTRLPVTQQDRDLFAAYNATRPVSDQRAVVGQIAFSRQTYFNSGRVFVNGFDYNLTYRLPEYAMGRFTVSTEWTRLNSFFRYGRPGDPRDDLRWENGAAKWRGNVNLSWKRKEWGAGASAYYIGSYQDTGATTTEARYQELGRPGYISEVFDTGLVRYRFITPSTTTYNAYVTYNFRGKRDWLNGTSVRLGVINLENLAPPLDSESRGYDPSVYGSLARGRTWSVQLSRKF